MTRVFTIAKSTIVVLSVLFATGCSSMVRPSDGATASDASDARDTARDVANDCGDDGCEDIGSWVHRFGGEGPSGATRSATDRDGNIYVAGEGSLASFMSDGTPRWSHFIRGTSAQSIATDRVGNVYVAGYFSGSVDFGGGELTASLYRRDPFVASFTREGAYRWARAFGDPGREVSARVAVDDAQNVFVTGIFAGTLDFGGGPVESVGLEYNLYVAGFTMNGDYRWARRFDRGTVAGAPRVATDASGNIYLAGEYRETVDFGDGPLPRSDGGSSYLASLTSTGTTRWSRDIGGNMPTGFAVTRDGASIVVQRERLVRYSSDGVYRSTQSFDPQANFATLDDEGRLYLVEGSNVASFTAAGERRWTRGFGPAAPSGGYVLVSDLRADGAGNVYLDASFTDRADFGSGVLVGGGSALASFASDGTPRWSLRFGSGWDRAHSVAVHDDDVYLAGTFTHRVDFGGGALVTSNDAEIYLASFTRAGAHRWSRRLGGVGSFRNRHHIAIDREGNLYLAGLFAGTVDFGGGAIANTLDTIQPSEAEVYVASFTRDGTHRWSHRIGSTLHARGVDVVVSASGTLAVSYGNTLATFGTDGQPRWSHSFDGIRSDRGAPHVAVDDSGNVTFTGVFFGATDFGGGALMPTGMSDVFVASFAPGGAHRWSRSVGRSDEDLGSNIAVDASGRVYLAAFFRGVPQFGGPVLPRSTTVFRSYSADGDERWTHRLDGVGAANDGATVAIDAQGDVYLTGEFQGAVDFGSGAQTAPDFSDGFIASFDAGGTSRWTRVFRGRGFSSAGNGVAIDRSGGVYVAGSFTGSVDFGIDRLASESSRDIFLARIAP